MESSKFWRWAEVRVRASQLRSILTSQRLRSISCLSLHCSRLTSYQVKEVLQTIGRTSEYRMRTVSLSGRDLSSICPLILSAATLHLRELDITKTILTPAQLNLLFHKLRLDVLHVGGQNLSLLSGDVLVRAMLRLETLNMEDCKLRSKQLIDLFSKVATSTNLRLSHLSLTDLEMSSMPAVLFSKAAVRLESLSLVRTSLSSDHLTALFTAIREGQDVRLKVLCVGREEMSGVEPDLISQAGDTLTLVNM